MTDNDILDRLELAERMLAHYSQKYDQMLTQFGSGVRPSWVSSDLADIGASAAAYRAEIAALKAELEASK